MKIFQKSLIACTLLAALIGASACSDSSTQPPVSVTGNTDSVSTEQVTEAIPQGPDLGGFEFRMTILGTEDNIKSTYVAEQDGNIVNDAVYQKIANVEERLNVKVISNDTTGMRADYLDEVKNSILAGDDTTDLVQGHDVNTANAAMEGLFLNIYDIPHLDFTQPWWPAETLESMTVAGQMYMMFNNLSYTSLASTRVMFFNKTLHAALDLPDIYQLVYDGKWTLDQMRVMVNEAYSDLNGDSKKDINDQIGFQYGASYCYLEPFKVEPYQRDADGNLYYEMDVERTQRVIDGLAGIFYSAGGLVTTDQNKCIAAFEDGRALFAYLPLKHAQQNFSYADDLTFGIVPMPKLDEAQDAYYAGSTDRPFVIPITADSRVDNIGYVVEAMNEEGYKQVYPAYFEISMKSRYADQTDDAKMLDIIRENTIISFSYLYSNYQSSYHSLLNDLVRKEKMNNTVASWAAKMEKSQIKYLESLMEFFSENK